MTVLALNSPSAFAADAGGGRSAGQYHCLGTALLEANTNLVAVNKIRSLRSSAAFYNLALAKLSTLLKDDFNLQTNAVSLLSPLMDDVLSTESTATFGGGDGSAFHFIMALNLTADQIQTWRSNLTQAFGGTGRKFDAGGYPGVRWGDGNARSLWLIRAGGWLLVGSGDAFQTLQQQYLKEIKRTGRPVPALNGQWLSGDLDCARLRPWLPEWLRLVKPARVKISVAVEPNFFHETAQLTFPEEIPWQSRAWEVPTNLIRNPLVSFAAGQDVRQYLDLSPDFAELWDSILTNQFYGWCNGQMPFQSYVAWPVKNGDKVLEDFSARAGSVLGADLKRLNGGELQWQADTKRLVLINLGMIAPAIEPAKDGAADYLLLNMFPLSPENPPMEPKLLKEIIGQTNLVYYDWEFTGPRLQIWRLVGEALMSRPGVAPKSAKVAKGIENRWLAGLSPLVGNSVTAVTRVSAHELSVVRNSPVGLTAFEILMFSDWLDKVELPTANQ